MSWEQITPLLVESGLPLEQIAKATAELSDGNLWFPAIALIAAWGRRPNCTPGGQGHQAFGLPSDRAASAALMTKRRLSPGTATNP